MAKTLRFIIVPKVAHPWFDEVNKGARAQAEILSRELGVGIVVITQENVDKYLADTT